MTGDTSGGMVRARVVVYRRDVVSVTTAGGADVGSVVVLRDWPRFDIDIDRLFDAMKQLNGFQHADRYARGRMNTAIVWKMPLPNAIRLKNRQIRNVRRVFSRALSWRRWRWRGHAGARPKRRLAG